MIGCLKLTPTGIVARSGFKYIRFDPNISILPDREMIIYKDVGYEYEQDIVYVSYSARDIKKETMSAIVLSNCKILNRISYTGKCTTNTGKRSVVFKEDFGLSPIVTRNVRGPIPERCDTQAYSDDNYIKFNISWNKKGEQKSIDTSLVEYDEEELWQKLKEHYEDVHDFLQRQKRTSSNLMSRSMYDRFKLNSDHLVRFRDQYGDEFMMNYEIDLDKFKSMDVIDLTTIQEIKIDTKDQLKSYSIYEILPNTIIHRGVGFTSELLDSISERKDKYYCMLVDNSIEHKIRKHAFATLYINTKVLVPEELIDEVDLRPELVFLKFNRLGLKKWLTNNIISNL